MNRRQALRFNYGEIAERYDLDGKTLLEKGKIVDVSETGILFKGSCKLNVGDRFKFRFEIGGKYLFLDGLVMRADTHALDKMPVSGIKLLFTDAQRLRLGQILARPGHNPIP